MPRGGKGMSFLSAGHCGLFKWKDGCFLRGRKGKKFWFEVRKRNGKSGGGVAECCNSLCFKEL